MSPRTGTARRRTRVVAVAAGAALLLAACSGSGASTTTTAAPPASEPTTTAARTTTTAVPRPDADELTTTLARAVPLTANDFPGGWRVHTEGRVRTLTTGSCSYREDGPEAALGTGAVQDGPTMQLGDQPGFITSTGYVFADEGSAEAWLEAVRSEEWAECRARELTEFQEENDTGLSVRLDSREIEQLGRRGFESYAQFYGRDADDSVALVVNVMHYRLGKVVLENTLERSMALDEVDWAAVDNAHADAVASAWARLNELPTR